MSTDGEGLPLSKLSCFAVAEEEGKSWFAWSQANGLYEFDKIKKNAKLLMRFQDFSIDKIHLYFAIEKVGTELVLAPGSASKIVFYDLDTGKAEYSELAPVENNRRVKYAGDCKFLKSYRYGDIVYFFGFEYPAVLKINVKTKQIIYLDHWVKEVEPRIKKTSATMGYMSDYVSEGNCIWALCECANAILRLDLQTDAIQIIDICSDLDVRCGIYFDGDFWITGYNESTNKLLKYNHSFVLEKEIEIYSARKDDEDYAFSLQENLWEIYPIIDLGDRLLLFSVYPRHVYEVSKDLCEVRICPVFEQLLKARDERLHDMGILTPRKKENCIYFITGNDFLWNEYDFVHNTIIRYEVRAESDEEFLRFRSKLMSGRIFIENEMTWDFRYKLTLSRFIKHIAFVPKAETDDVGKDNSIGNKIFYHNCKMSL